MIKKFGDEFLKISLYLFRVSPVKNKFRKKTYY